MGTHRSLQIQPNRNFSYFVNKKVMKECTSLQERLRAFKHCQEEPKLRAGKRGLIKDRRPAERKCEGTGEELKLRFSNG